LPRNAHSHELKRSFAGTTCSFALSSRRPHSFLDVGPSGLRLFGRILGVGVEEDIGQVSHFFTASARLEAVAHRWSG
jgi:hypothetical protein